MDDENFHTLLPEWAQLLLRKAASVPNTPEDTRKRDKCIETVDHELRLRIPGAFVSDRDDQNVVCRKKR